MKTGLIVLFLFVFSSCAPLAGGVNDVGADKTGVKTKVPIKDQIEALGPEDPRRQQIMTLTWQIQYQRERLKSLESQYLAACYKGKEYRDALTAIENLNKQVRQLILL